MNNFIKDNPIIDILFIVVYLIAFIFIGMPVLFFIVGIILLPILLLCSLRYLPIVVAVLATLWIYHTFIL